MKKTFTININGTVFHIEEDAYDVLQVYLNSLKSHFGNDEEGKEIISDIEARIGEIFNEKSNEINKVVTLDWVNDAIAIMGTPEDIVNEEGATEVTVQQTRRQKRLYRDPEHRTIGGVCGGLGAYFNIDPLVFRIIFIVLFFAGGAALLAYLILWVAVPKAVTTGQLLEMRGQEATVKNIKNWVREEEKDVKETYRNFKSSETYASGKRGVETAGAVVSDGLSVLMRIIVILIGAFLIFISLW
jgi:phage shock protein PspC (stress-responsive transcriptional regulator)